MRFPRQFETLGGAAEQDDAQHVLQRADLLTDRRRGHRQFVGGAGKAQMAGSGVEDAQRVEGQMGALHDAVAGATSGKAGIAASICDPSVISIT